MYTTVLMAIFDVYVT